jgi:hypothetical protein
MNPLKYLFFCVALTLSFLSAWSQEQSRTVEDSLRVKTTHIIAEKDSLPYVISIERVKVGNMRIHDTLAITLNSFVRSLAGFELKFGLESPFIDIDTVLPGELSDSCRWEFFNSRSLTNPDRVDYPPILWQAVAIAQVSPGERGPICYGLDGEVSLAKLVVTSEHVTRVPDTVAPIFFFWEDCTDNTISAVSGDTLAISAKVLNFQDVEYTGDLESFPNRTGALDDCINPNKPNRPHRLIEFHTGGVEFKLDVGEHQADSTEKK